MLKQAQLEKRYFIVFIALNLKYVKFFALIHEITSAMVISNFVVLSDNDW